MCFAADAVWGSFKIQGILCPSVAKKAKKRKIKTTPLDEKVCPNFCLVQCVWIQAAAWCEKKTKVWMHRACAQNLFFLEACVLARQPSTPERNRQPNPRPGELQPAEVAHPSRLGLGRQLREELGR